MTRLAIGLVATAGVCLALAGCTKKEDVPQNQKASAVSAPSNGHAGQFLTQAIAGDIGEIQLAQLAASRASDKAVRDLADTVVRDHGTSKDQAVQLANSLGATVPTAAVEAAQSEYHELQGVSGKDFDKEFVSSMVSDHQKAIVDYQSEAGTSDPAPVTDFARKTLPVIENHLQMAQSLETGLNAKGR